MEEQAKYVRKSETNVPAPKPTAKISTHKGFDEEIIVKVNDYIKTKEAEGLVIPPDYSVTNALIAAKLHLLDLRDKEGRLIVEQVTTASVVNALTKMVTSGFNVNKKHCSFIKYADKLVCQAEYFGNLMIAKRDANVKEVNGNCVYQGDEFVYEVDTNTGRQKIVKHSQKLENRNNAKIKGAYAIVLYNDGTSRLEVMNIEEIRAAWNMGSAKGASPAHKDFTDQMAIKTVENRAVKIDINTSDDSEIMPEDLALAARQQQIQEKSGKKELAEDIPYEDLNKAEQPIPPAEATPDPEPIPLSELGTEKAPY